MKAKQEKRKKLLFLMILMLLLSLLPVNTFAWVNDSYDEYYITSDPSGNPVEYVHIEKGESIQLYIFNSKTKERLDATRWTWEIWISLGSSDGINITNSGKITGVKNGIFSICAKEKGKKNYAYDLSTYVGNAHEPAITIDGQYTKCYYLEIGEEIQPEIADIPKKIPLSMEGWNWKKSAKNITLNSNTGEIKAISNGCVQIWAENKILGERTHWVQIYVGEIPYESKYAFYTTYPSKKEADFDGNKKKNVTDLILPSTISIFDPSLGQGIYNITSVTPYVRDEKIVQNIIVPESITKIGKQSLGWYDTDIDDVYFEKKCPDVILYGQGMDSAAAEYAKENRFKYIDLQGNDVQIIKTNTTEYKKTHGDKSFTLAPKASQGGELSYTTNNPEVAIVNGVGKIRIKGPGIAKISIDATAPVGYMTAVKRIKLIVAPKKVKGIKLKSSSKKMTIKWKKVPKASGYIIRLYRKGSGYYEIIDNGNKTKRTIKKLKKNQICYVKIRAYKKSENKIVYGSYTKTKKIKIK